MSVEQTADDEWSPASWGVWAAAKVNQWVREHPTLSAGDTSSLEGWDSWIEAYGRYLASAGRPATTRSLRRCQLRYVARTIGAGPGRVSTDMLSGWLHDRVAGWKHETLRSYSMSLRGFYGWAVETGRVRHNPGVGLPKIPMRRGLPRPAPEHVWRMALERADDRVALMLRLAAEAGLRRGEIAHVQVGDVASGFDGPVLLVRGKGGKDRRVPITESLASAIVRVAGDGEWVFGSKHGGHVSPQWVGELCAGVLRSSALGGGRFTLHSLRHRFGSAAYQGSHDLRAVQELLGHSSPSVTQLYVAVGEDALRAAMNAAS